MLNMESTSSLISSELRLENSPYLLLQEIYRDDPWKMLICCIFLNCTKRSQVDAIRDQFFSKYPNAHAAENAEASEIAELISSLGFKNRRTRSIQRFSTDWIDRKSDDVSQLYGIGKYANDSWQIFQLGNLQVEPTDGVLKKYLEWAKTKVNT
jgi:endonuclease III